MYKAPDSKVDSKRLPPEPAIAKLCRFQPLGEECYILPRIPRINIEMLLSLQFLVRWFSAMWVLKTRYV